MADLSIAFDGKHDFFIRAAATVFWLLKSLRRLKNQSPNDSIGNKFIVLFEIQIFGFFMKGRNYLLGKFKNPYVLFVWII